MGRELRAAVVGAELPRHRVGCSVICVILCNISNSPCYYCESTNTQSLSPGSLAERDCSWTKNNWTHPLYFHPEGCALGALPGGQVTEARDLLL